MSRFSLCLVLVPLLLQTGCTMTGPAPGGNQPVARREHYDPAYLNEAAVAALAAGDRGTALILLERAAILAPKDARIKENLAVLKTGRLPVMPPREQSAKPAGADKPPAIAPGSSTPAMGIWPLK